MSEPIKLLVTRERFEEIVSIDDSMNFMDLTSKEVYDYMVHFVYDETCNNLDNYLLVEDARKLFKKIPRKELSGYITKFMEAITNAFVNPPNGKVSEEQS